jgi:hypothetical protein
MRVRTVVAWAARQLSNRSESHGRLYSGAHVTPRGARSTVVRLAHVKSQAMRMKIRADFDRPRCTRIGCSMPLRSHNRAEAFG